MHDNATKANKPRRLGRMPGADASRPTPDPAAEADRRLDAILKTTEGQRRDWKNDHRNPQTYLWGHWQRRYRNQDAYHEFRLALERRGLASASEPVIWRAAA